MFWLVLGLLERELEVLEKAHFDVSPLINTSSSGALLKQTSLDVWVLPTSINKTLKQHNQTGKWGRKRNNGSKIITNEEERHANPPQMAR